MELRYLTIIFLIACGIRLPAQWVPDPLDLREQRRIEQGERKVKALAHLISKGDSDEEQVRSIYHWVTRHIRLDRRAHRNFGFPTHEVYRTLRRHKGTPLAFATLFQRLCDAQGIPCKVVLGYTKPAEYRIGSRFQRGSDAWNAVQIHGTWQLVDASWGAARLIVRKQPLRAWLWRKFKWAYPRRYRFQRRPSDDWCLMPPDSFRLTHLPIAPAWQLTDTALSLSAFEAAKDTFPPLLQDHLAGVTKMEIGNAAEQAVAEAEAGKAENPRDDLDIAWARILMGQIGLRQPPEAGGDTILWKRSSAELATARQHLVLWMRQVGKEQRTRMKELRQLERASKYANLYTRGEWKIVQIDDRNLGVFNKMAFGMVNGEASEFWRKLFRIMDPMPRLDSRKDSLRPALKAKIDAKIAECHRDAQVRADTVTKYYRKLQTESTRIYIAADTIERERNEMRGRVWDNLEAIMADSELTYRRSCDTLSAFIRSNRAHRLRHNRLSDRWWRMAKATINRNMMVLSEVELARKQIEKLYAEGMGPDSLLARQIYLRETFIRWWEIRDVQASIAMMQSELEEGHVEVCREIVRHTVKPRIAQERLTKRYLRRERRKQNRRFHAEMRLAHHMEQRVDQGLERLRQWISEARAAARNR